MADYYDWNKTLSYGADVTMVIGARGVGKTFGLRLQFVRDWKKDGSRFVEVCRYKNELSGVSDGYFNRVCDMPACTGLRFRTDAKYAYVADENAGDVIEMKDGREKIRWHVIGYFAALSDAQRLKKRTFDHVKRIVMDEAVLERTDRYHRYLPNEFGVLANLVDTVSRERPEEPGSRPFVYLLGNACDITNPYFVAYGVGTDIEHGYRWYADKTFILHYADAGEYTEKKLKGTVAGRMIAGTAEGKVAAANEFIAFSKEFVKAKPSRAKFSFGIVCNGKTYGVWFDMTGGHVHVTRKIPQNTEKPVWSLTASDSGLNYLAATKANRTLQTLADLWYAGSVRYEDATVQHDFLEVLSLFGIR